MTMKILRRRFLPIPPRKDKVRVGARADVRVSGRVLLHVLVHILVPFILNYECRYTETGNNVGSSSKLG